MRLGRERRALSFLGHAYWAAPIVIGTMALGVSVVGEPGHVAWGVLAGIAAYSLSGST